MKATVSDEYNFYLFTCSYGYAVQFLEKYQLCVIKISRAEKSNPF